MIPDALILTPNRRLAATLLRQHHVRAIQQGATSWRTPVILPLSAWLQQSWHTSLLRDTSGQSPILLTPSQEILLWERILADSSEQTRLLQLSETAQLASKAWGLLKGWQVALNHPMLSLTEEGQAFQRWASDFQTRLDQQGWLDTASLPDRLVTCIEQGRLPMPDTLQLAGFMEIAPQFETLFNTFRQHGCDVRPFDVAPPPSDASAHRICLADEEMEIRTMARWAKQRHEENPHQTIGCIIPRLDRLREEVLHIFSDTFSTPDTLIPHHGHLPFNLSAGKKLTDWPLIRTALLLTTAMARPLTPSELTRLDYSPFAGATVPSTPDTSATLRQSPSQWVRQVARFLKASGWPGDRSLSSDEYQMAQRWLELLNEYATFDALIPEADLNSTLDGLQRLAERTLWQPHSPPAPVQIAGILEAAGQPYDHLWIMGMDDTQWPSSPRPNPLIPLPLQRTLHMPHATAERERRYCEQLFTQLRESSTHLIGSYAEQADDTPLRPAALLDDLPIITPEALAPSPDLSPAEQVFAHATTEWFEDNLAPPVNPTEVVRGGSHILRHQAACPFRAFAEVRLHAAATDPDTVGLDAKERGKLLHKTLESLWQHLKDSDTLQQYSADALHTLCETMTRDAMQTCLRQSPEDSRYLAMEWERMTRLVSAWLETEKNRPPFRVIACETPLTLTLAGLTLNLRMDRVDQLQDGSHLIIDYKTGKHASPADWSGDRPTEPQLPLYCISGGDTISALAFATLHPDIRRLSGLSATDTGIRSIRIAPEWQAQLDEWQTHLTRLADDFCRGDARVDPKQGSQTCEHCHLQTFCRIHERTPYAAG